MSNVKKNIRIILEFYLQPLPHRANYAFMQINARQKHQTFQTKEGKNYKTRRLRDDFTHTETKWWTIFFDEILVNNGDNRGARRFVETKAAAVIHDNRFLSAIPRTAEFSHHWTIAFSIQRAEICPSFRRTTSQQGTW